MRERLKSKDKDGWSPVDAWVKNKHAFFFIYIYIFIVSPTESVQFDWGFVGFRFLKPNRTEFVFKNFNRFNRFFL